MKSPGGMRPGGFRTLAAPAGLVLATALVYANSLRAPLVFDDRLTILENPTIRTLWPPWHALQPPPDQAATGRPVFNLSLALNYAVSGAEPWSYHVLNVAIHALAALVLFGLVRRTLLGERLQGRYAGHADALAFTCVLLWALHPLCSQAVTYITQRAEALAGLFALLTLYAAFRSATSPRPRAWRAAAVGSCLLGVFTKELAGVAPFLVLIHDAIFLRRGIGQALRRAPGLYAGLALSVGVLVALLAVGGVPAQAVEARSFGWPAYAWNQGPVIVHYLRLALWPHPLVFDYAWPIATFAQALPGAIAVLALLAATGVALARWPAVGFLGAWFFITLAPSSSVIPLRFLAFEYRMYLPLMAVVAGAVVAGFEIARALDRRYAAASVTSPRFHGVPRALRAAAAVALIAALGLGSATVARNQVYASERALWEDTVRHRPTNPRAHVNLGRALVDGGQRERAIGHFAEALRLDPGNALAHSNLGGVLDLMGDLEGARRHYEEALRLDPNLAEAHGNLAGILDVSGRSEEALRHFAAALRLRPAFPAAHYNLGRTLLRLGRRDEAADHFEAALRLEPGFALARRELAALRPWSPALAR